MSEPFIGEIRIFAGYYAPKDWAFCDGQTLPVSGNEALYSLFGNRYGGTAPTNFGLPDLRGRIPVHMGQGPGLSTYTLGQKAGAEKVTLTAASMPQHNHPMQASTDGPVSVSPGDHILGNVGINLYGQGTDPSSKVAIYPKSVADAGENTPHTNMMPYLCINFIVALNGIFPPRN